MNQTFNNARRCVAALMLSLIMAFSLAVPALADSGVIDAVELQAQLDEAAAGTGIGVVTLATGGALSANVVVPPGAVLIVPPSASLTVPSSISLTISGEVEVAGSITNSGTVVVNSGALLNVFEGTFSNNNRVENFGQVWIDGIFTNASSAQFFNVSHLYLFGVGVFNNLGNFVNESSGEILIGNAPEGLSISALSMANSRNLARYAGVSAFSTAYTFNNSGKFWNLGGFVLAGLGKFVNTGDFVNRAVFAVTGDSILTNDGNLFNDATGSFIVNDDALVNNSGYFVNNGDVILYAMGNFINDGTFFNGGLVYNEDWEEIPADGLDIGGSGTVEPNTAGAPGHPGNPPNRVGQQQVVPNVTQVGGFTGAGRHRSGISGGDAFTSSVSAARREARIIAANASNDTSAESVLSPIQSVMASGVSAAWSQNTPFRIVPATATTDGRITGLIQITYSTFRTAIVFDIVLPALEADEVEDDDAE
ncbi:MAG: hypothetical protein FWE20_10255 [Defluviitaleaceae bacterium]|nr:hypothetical protein [Defluviitaleaceae bacterium]